MSLQPPVGPDDHAEGPADAPVTLVEYGDYQCPFCGEAYPIVKQIQQHFGDRLRFVFRNFPLADMHPQAMAAANVADYCGTLGQFWKAHDALYSNQDQLGPRLYVQIAEACGGTAEGVQHAVESNQFGSQIEASIESGIRSGVNGTPTFFVNGQRADIQSFGQLAELIQEQMPQ